MVNTMTNAAKAATNAAVSATNAAVTTATDAVSSATTAATDAVSSATTAATDTATSIFNSVTNTAANVPFLNSLLSNTRTNSSGSKTNNGTSNTFGNIFNSSNRNNNANRNNNVNRSSNTSTNAAMNVGNADSYGSYAIYIFSALVLVFVIFFALFNQQIKMGYQYLQSNIRKFLNMSVPPDVSAAVSPEVQSTDVTVPAEAPQDVTPKEATLPQPTQTSLVEKILPASNNQVYNVAQNKFTYYDAEPLCNALGAELATYDQVKDAWSNGADWCNYGWVKGQMAVYPTQKATYEKLQMGPADQRGACGTVGINGGYFDNPEFKYGVNCFGPKPPQGAHDEAMLMSQGKVPKTPETLKVDELVAEYKDEADALFVRPFNDQKWGAA